MDINTATSTAKAINRHLRRKQILAGGLMFGLDYVTWRICHPHLCQMLDEAGKAITGRSSRFLPRWRYSNRKPV